MSENQDDLDVLMSMIDEDSDQETDTKIPSNEEVPSTSDNKQPTSTKISEFEKVLEKSDENADEPLDPLEAELLQMEKRMKLLKQKLNKKKSNQGSSLSDQKEVSQKPAISKPLAAKVIPRNHSSEIHQGDTDSEDDDDKRNPMEQTFSSYGKSIKKTLDKSMDRSRRSRDAASERLEAGLPSKSSSWKKPVVDKDKSKDSESKDPFSGIRLINPVVSSSTMAGLMASRKMVQMSSIHNYARHGDIDGDWVTIGVVVSKTETKMSQKGTQYSIFQLSDLKDCTKSSSLFLFGEAYKKLWKTSVGSVLGILNASFMKENTKSNPNCLATLSVNNPQNVLLMGQSKDLGFCKGRTKAGSNCHAFVNKDVCEFCIYHIQREYQKTCSKRADIQSSFSRVDPRKALQKRVLGKSEVFYGGQSFSSPSTVKATPKTKQKKSLLETTSSSMSMKAKLLQKEEEKKALDLKHLNTQQKSTIIEVANDNEQFGNMLLAPTLGARNFLHHKDKEPVQKEETKSFQSVSARDFIKMSQKSRPNVQAPVKKSLDTLCAGGPKLGRGLASGGSIEFDVPAPILRASDIKKAKAVAILKGMGPIQPKNPNMVRNKEKVLQENYQDRIKKRLSSQVEDEDDEKPGPKRSKKEDGSVMKRYTTSLGTIDLNDEKMKELIGAKSQHNNLIEAVEDERMDKYYNTLEKKEMLENKMTSIMEMPVSAVTCIQCKYTAQSALETCKEEKHTLKFVKTTKRFFECLHCKRRTTSLQKLPQRPCSNCESSSWKRVAMGKERKGPVLESEVLCTRGNELSNYSSTSNQVYLHVDS